MPFKPASMQTEDPIDEQQAGLPATPDAAGVLQYRLHKLENVLQLERKLRRSKDEQTQVLRQRLRQLLQVALSAREREHSLRISLHHQPHAASADADATVLSHPLAYSDTPAENQHGALRAAAQTTLPPQFRLFEYRIDSVLGQGGFGITYLATDVNLNAKVAIKEYLPTAFAYRDSNLSVQPRHADDRHLYQTGLDNFLLEARTLATFRHPNIVRVARFFEAHRSAYMVLEYERGQPLRSWWNHKKPLAEAELLALLRPLLDGLGQVHEAGYWHRDIKPDNIYVRHDDGSLVLLDFGAAQHVNASSHDLSAIVTPGYAPPEQYEAGGQGPWTDIYAFAATLYWLVAGYKPAAAPERMADPSRHQSACELGAGRYSEHFLRAIDAGLQLDASQRPQNLVEFSQALFAAHSASLGLQAALRMHDTGEANRALNLAGTWRMLLKSPSQLQRRVKHLARAMISPSSWPMAIKMTLALTLAALLPMLITAYYNLNGSLQAVSSSESRNLERLAQSIAGRVGQLVGDNRNLANYLATDEVFIEYLRQPNETGKARIYEKIHHLHQTNPDVHRLLLIDRHGLVLISSDPAVVGKQSQFRDYFRAAMAGKSFVTSMLVSITDGSIGIFYSNPVYNQERQVIGAVVLRLKGSTVDQLMVESTAGTGRIPFLIDGDGIMISHPDQKQRFQSLGLLSPSKQAELLYDQRYGKQPINSLGMSTLAQAMLSAKKHGNLSFFSTISQELEHAGYAPVPGHNWVVGIAEPRSQFEAPLHKLFVNVLYSVALVGLIFILLAMWFARTIVRPVLRLTEAANALKDGDFDKANIKVSSNDEIGRLARTFNVMIDVLRQRERERKRGPRTDES